jgi:hypothetical protein
MQPINRHSRDNCCHGASDAFAPIETIRAASRMCGIAAVAALIAIATAASAQPPTPYPPPQSPQSCAPITKAGFYELETSLTATAPGDCIVIKAANVTLNLNNNSITGHGGSGGIRRTAGADAITSGGGAGIHVMPGAANAFIEGNGAVISGFIEGIEIDAPNAFAEHFTVSTNGDAGVYLNAAKQAKISNFTADGNFNDGVRIFKGGMNLLQGFSSENNGRYGVWLEASSHNTIGGGGFYVQDNKIAGIYLGCWSVGPQGRACKPAMAPSNYNSIFDGGAYGASGGTENYGVAIDLGENFNKVAGVTSLYNSTDDVIDNNIDCAGNLWMSITDGTSIPPAPGCIP